MAIDLRILHTADSHIGADLPKRRSTRPRRGSDFVDSHRRVLEQARQLRVDLVIHAGDLFDIPEPGEGAIAAATGPLWDLARAGITVILVPGNHERSVLPETLLLAHPNIHILREPGTVRLKYRGLRVAVAGFPCIRRGAAGRFAQQLQQTGWEPAAADINVLAVHQVFAGARCGPGNFQFRAGDEVVPCEAVPPGFHYVSAGHIHRHQSLAASNSDGAPIVYAGAPDRITFAELGEPKGCVVVEFADGRVRPRFVGHPVRPMAVLPVNVTDCTGGALASRVLDSLRDVPESAVVLLRLAGQAGRNELAGLRLTHQIRAARPDLMVAISYQAVEWVNSHAKSCPPGSVLCSAFRDLDGPPTPITSYDAVEAGELPHTCGTYALYDGSGRLLYVGKAMDVRSRVRTHLRGSSPSGYFSKWSAQIARVEVRPAGSELEALLVEAELIRRSGPAFNRQMRSWRRYWYLCAWNRPYAQLEIRAEPVSGRFTFGPLRSRARAEAALEALSTYFGLARCPDQTEGHRKRLLLALSPAHLCERYFAGRCTGPCGGRVDHTMYTERVRARDSVLRGEETADAVSIQAELDQLASASAGNTGPQLARLRMLQVLAALHDTAVLLRDARALLGRAMLLPSQDGFRTVATITHRGLRLRRLDGELAVVLTSFERQHGRPDRCWPGNQCWLPKSVADCLCTAVKQLRRHPTGYGIVNAPPEIRPATVHACPGGLQAAIQ